MGDELLTALDYEGKILAEGVPRAKAHRHGVWHRSIAVIVLNPNGEVLLEKRSPHKDLFPNFYDIPGGHVKFRASALGTALEELREELGLALPASRLAPLCDEDALTERIVLPEHSIVNRERKTAYVVELNAFEENQVLFNAAQSARLSDQQLEERGALGEVSHVEFWTFECLVATLQHGNGCNLASGTESVLANDAVRQKIHSRCVRLREAQWKAYRHDYEELLGAADLDPATIEGFLSDTPANATDEAKASAIFEAGRRQIAGAYEIGSFRAAVGGDEYWQDKIRDPTSRYVRNLLLAIAFRRPPKTFSALLDMTDDAVEFVTRTLDLPLADGRRLRDRLGNLADIAVARNATVLYVRRREPDLIDPDELRAPLRAFVDACLAAGRNLLLRLRARESHSLADRLRDLVLLNLSAASVDFNNPDLQEEMSRNLVPGAWIESYVQNRWQNAQFCDELGGTAFLTEFLRVYVESCAPAILTYLAGNSVQAYISLALCQELLQSNPFLEVRFVPKSGSPGNDLTYSDVERLLSGEGKALFPLLLRSDARFRLVSDGPACHGLNPAALSRNVADALLEATVIVADGQAYAELSGWKKPVYIAYRVNGRVAEVVHGVARQRGAIGFVRLTPGIRHFEGFHAAMNRRLPDISTGLMVRAAAQTTREYVAAIRSANLRALVERVFVGNESDAIRHILAESLKLGRTFADVILGVASAVPDPESVRLNFHFTQPPVFGCGGGGGFNQVTLKALRKLGRPLVAGLPATDDGGSSGELQHWFQGRGRFLFGVGDLAGLLQECVGNKGKQAVLSYRFDQEHSSLPEAVMDRVIEELRRPTFPESPIGASPDFISFICDQLNLARIIDSRFRNGSTDPLPIRGASIRNLNVIAAYEICAPLGSVAGTSEEQRLAALYILQKALGVDRCVMPLPVTYEECRLYLDYAEPVDPALAAAFHVPASTLVNEGHRLFGQCYIDKLPQPGGRIAAGVLHSERPGTGRPSCSPEYLRHLRQAGLFVMGAGSLFSSQLAQLAIQGFVKTLISRTDIRRILVINHVKLDETRGMSLRAHVEAIEATATAAQGTGGRIQIGDLFTDVVLPRTVAREIEEEMIARSYEWLRAENDSIEHVCVPTSQGNTSPVVRNRYIDFLITNPDVQQRLAITAREMEVLSCLDQPPSLYGPRTEAGRYRGALYATPEDIDYLIAHGIQRRNIHEIDSVGENSKLLKAEGAPVIEYFPGLVADALSGIFQIALERAAPARQTSATREFGDDTLAALPRHVS